MSVEIIEGGPECMRDDCMLQMGVSTMTLAHFPQIFNKNGDNVNPDGNLSITDVRCLSCGKSWKEGWKNGTKISFK